MQYVVNIYVYIHVYMYVYIYVHTHMYVYNQCAYICMYIYTCIYIYVYTSTHTHARRHTDRVGQLSSAAPEEAAHECPLVLALLPQVLSDLCVCACV